MPRILQVIPRSPLLLHFSIWASLVPFWGHLLWWVSGGNSNASYCRWFFQVMFVSSTIFRARHTRAKGLCSPMQVTCLTTWLQRLTNQLSLAKRMLRPRPRCSLQVTFNKRFQANSKFNSHQCPTNSNNKFHTNRGSLRHHQSIRPRVHRMITMPSLLRNLAWRATRVFPRNHKWFTRSSRCFDSDGGLVNSWLWLGFAAFKGDRKFRFTRQDERKEAHSQPQTNDWVRPVWVSTVLLSK